RGGGGRGAAAAQAGDIPSGQSRAAAHASRHAAAGGRTHGSAALPVRGPGGHRVAAAGQAGDQGRGGRADARALRGLTAAPGARGTSRGRCETGGGDAVSPPPALAPSILSTADPASFRGTKGRPSSFVKHASEEEAQCV